MGVLTQLQLLPGCVSISAPTPGCPALNFPVFGKRFFWEFSIGGADNQGLRMGMKDSLPDPLTSGFP